MANPSRVENLLDIEVYTQSPVQTGRVLCPVAVRVLDLLNNQFFSEPAGDESFLELIETESVPGQETPRVYFKKSAIELIALTDADTGRGIGSVSSNKIYPYVCKMPRRVTIDLHSYTVVGSMHCASNQSVMSILNERKAFLPLTDAVIMDASGFRGERPFAAVNRHQIISLREDRYFHTS
jgi:hypothetical protein